LSQLVCKMAPDASSWQCRIDLHVHTRRYSPCAEAIDPEQLHRVMDEARLRGLVITEHDQLWPAEELAQINRKLKNGRIYRGVEVSTRNGHFVVIGLDSMDGIRAGIGIEDLVKRSQAQQAAVIWAHPMLNYGNTPDPLPVEKMPPGIHAIEVASGMTNGSNGDKARAIAKRMGWSPVGGSDAHCLSQIGSIATLFPRLPKDEKALARAIKSGRCKAEGSKYESNLECLITQ